jgi:hypothetical protein
VKKTKDNHLHCVMVVKERKKTKVKEDDETEEEWTCRTCTA